MNQSTVKILNTNPGASAIAASAARMSTQPGTALDVYKKSGDSEKDIQLIRKVLSSGHKSVIEHHTLSVAFNDVSVLVEQFVIEFRLASFTVKSRRYVDFSGAGYVVPDGLTESQRAAFCAQMERLFRTYSVLQERGIPKEDARFVLPYALRSNFFMTINARELILMIASMIAGRGARFGELRQIGEQLRAQFDALYPGVIEAELKQYRCPEQDLRTTEFLTGREMKGHAALIGCPEDPELLLETAMAFSGRFSSREGRFFCPENMNLLLNDSRARELEMLNYTFRISNISLACLTHFTRHRIQSPLIPDVIRALCRGDFIVPESVRADAVSFELYCRAFADQAAAVRDAEQSDMAPDTLAYYAMSGHVTDILLTANARELLHFAKLRTCTRAQWEIRGVARQMLVCLNQTSPAIFQGYGPSCAVTGRCPEGRMSCGHPVHIENGVWMTRGNTEEETTERE